MTHFPSPATYLSDWSPVLKLKKLCVQGTEEELTLLAKSSYSCSSHKPSISQLDIRVYLLKALAVSEHVPMPGCLRHMMRSGWCFAMLASAREPGGLPG